MTNTLLATDFTTPATWIVVGSALGVVAMFVIAALVGASRTKARPAESPPPTAAPRAAKPPAAAAPADIPPVTLAVIAAAVFAALGRRPARIRRVRQIASSAWSQAGRQMIHGSHSPRG